MFRAKLVHHQGVNLYRTYYYLQYTQMWEVHQSTIYTNFEIIKILNYWSLQLYV